MITLDQVQLAIRATGRSLAGESFNDNKFTAFTCSGKEVAELVRGFSSDEKNCSMEFNEFLKMMATEERKDSQPKGDALLEAFRSFSLCLKKYNFIPAHSRTFDKDCDGKLKPEELLGILTWDDSKLPDGLQEVIKEFQDSDGLILYEGTC